MKKFIYGLTVFEFLIIIYLLLYSRYPEYEEYFPGEMQTSLLKISEEVFTLHPDYDGIIDLKQLSSVSKKTIVLYGIKNIKIKDVSIFFVLESWIDDSAGIIYSRGWNPNLNGIKSVKLLGFGFFEYSTMY